MDQENGFDRSRLKGYLFEIVVLELLQKKDTAIILVSSSVVPDVN